MSFLTLTDVRKEFGEQVAVHDFDLSIARGLDYYTGTVYETLMRGYERFGSICSSE